MNVAIRPEMNQSQAIRAVLDKKFAIPAQEAVDYLKTKGIDTNINLVNSIRHQLRKNGSAVHASKDGQAAKPKTKSFYVRAYLINRGVDSSTDKVLKAMERQSIAGVSEKLVAKVREQLKAEGFTVQANTAAPAMPSAVPAGVSDLEDAKRVREFVQQMGGKTRMLHLLSFVESFTAQPQAEQPAAPPAPATA